MLRSSRKQLGNFSNLKGIFVKYLPSPIKELRKGFGLCIESCTHAEDSSVRALQAVRGEWRAAGRGAEKRPDLYGNLQTRLRYVLQGDLAFAPHRQFRPFLPDLQAH
jgi:hypothetical protein